MKKLTAVSVSSGKNVVVRFLMLETDKCVRGGQVDIKSRIDGITLNRLANEAGAIDRGDTFIVG